MRDQIGCHGVNQYFGLFIFNTLQYIVTEQKRPSQRLVTHDDANNPRSLETTTDAAKFTTGVCAQGL